MPADNRLNGLNPLAYFGVNSYSPPNLTLNKASPTPNDVGNFAVGALWINTTTQQAYILLSVSKNVANWQLFSDKTGDIQFLVAEDLNAVPPIAGGVGVDGDGINIHTTGNIGGNTLNIHLNNSIILPATTTDQLNGVISIGGAGAYFMHGFGVHNSFYGLDAGNFTLTGQDNTGIGFQSLLGLTSGNFNTALGSLSGTANASSSNNTSIGYNSLPIANLGNNTAVGSQTLTTIGGLQNSSVGALSGQTSTASASCYFGFQSGQNNSGNDVCAFGNSTLRLNTATGNCAFGFQSSLSNTSGTNNCSYGFQSQLINTTGSSNCSYGNTTLDANITGSSNSAFGNNSLGATTTSFCSAFGAAALQTNTTGVNNAFGFSALSTNSTGTRNCAFGTLSVTSNGLANDISAFGYNSLAGTTGSFNSALGSGALTGLLAGTGNLALGYTAGSAYAGAESNNILIGAGQTGVLGESDVTRIGVLGTQTTCFIAGIFGVTVGGSGVAVFVDNTGKLGTVVSSIKFKENVEDIDIGTKLHALRPVRFNYINAEDKSVKNYGLIAEEVLEVMPELIIYDNYKEPSTVKYHELPVLLLKEIQEMNKKILTLQEKISALENDAASK